MSSVKMPMYLRSHVLLEPPATKVWSIPFTQPPSILRDYSILIPPATVSVSFREGLFERLRAQKTDFNLASLVTFGTKEKHGTVSCLKAPSAVKKENILNGFIDQT